MVTAIIAAAGQGKRMNGGINKVFIPLFNRPLLTHTISVFEDCPDIARILIVVGKEDVEQTQMIVKAFNYCKIQDIVVGGRERQHSIANALQKIKGKTQWVAIHDGARPLLTRDLLCRGLDGARETGAAVVAVPVKDTIKTTDDQGMIVQTLDRQTLWAAQTPQVFAWQILQRAYQMAQTDGFLATDDAGLVERSGVKIKLVRGDYCNIKITTPEDLIVAEAILKGR